MSCKSEAYASIAWSQPTKEIIVTYNSGAVWAYPAKVQEYAVMHRNNVSAGRLLNRKLKARGGRMVKAKPLSARQLPLMPAVVVETSQALLNLMAESERLGLYEESEQLINA